MNHRRNDLIRQEYTPEYVPEAEEDKPEDDIFDYCIACNGSGEGQADGTSCIICAGSGHSSPKKTLREYDY